MIDDSIQPLQIETLETKKKTQILPALLIGPARWQVGQFPPVQAYHPNGFGSHGVSLLLVFIAFG
jgi:hypothetical protein